MLWNQLTFGVEIECYSPNSGTALATKIAADAGVPCRFFPSAHAPTPSGMWKVVPDASLNNPHNFTGFFGVEVVTTILRDEAGIASLTRVCNVLTGLGCKVNVNCGLHVHVGVDRDTTPPAILTKRMKNLAKMFIKNEHHFDSIVPPSRRSQRFAKSNRALASGVRADSLACYNCTSYASVANPFAAIDRARSVSGVASIMNGGYVGGTYPQERYYKLNFQSLLTHGTVEFRQAAGSVEAEKITTWVKLVTQFVAHAFTTDVNNIEEPTFASFLRKFDRKTAEYTAARRVRLNPNTTLPA
jgi:hypothetical protein